MITENVVKVIEYKDQGDLRKELKRIREECQSDSVSYSIKSLTQADESHLVALLEPDMESVRVRFFYCGNDVTRRFCREDSLVMTMREVQLINDLGLLKFGTEDEYGVESIAYYIGKDGKYVDITFN